MSNNLIPKSSKSPSDIHKSNFAQTCSLLSQYVKERRSFGDHITLGIPPKGPAEPVTLNLLSTMENSAEDTTTTTTATTKPAEPEPEPEIAPMTIFYGGQVFVFHDLSADKAREVMELAAKGGGGSTRSGSDSTNVSTAVVPKLEQNLTTTSPPDMRTVPRSSLHRFFEKRKQRIAAAKKAPYVAPPKQEQK